ncbi:hypothetical protein AGDE_09682 [Angomonas deanei]|nr:hypothetical protein AGDE_09682 [Angomonas deanei]|eukprot:EPY29962.1 hypothetical protein AGDE_09682 [Angomonas deanei]
MNTLTYNVDEHVPFDCKNDFYLVRMSATNFTEERKPHIASHKLLLCFSVKQPNVLRILHCKEGRFTDITLESDSVRHLISSPPTTALGTQFVAVGGQVLSVIEPQSNADANISAQTKTFKDFGEEIYSAAYGDGNVVYVLGEKHVFEVDTVERKVSPLFSLPPKTTVQYPTFDYCPKTKICVTPAKSAHLSLLSVTTKKSVLTQVWEPHPENAPTFAHIFKRSFSEESGNDLLLLTAANRNTELRFWSFNESSKKFVLKEELNITSAKSSNLRFEVSVDPSEEYITLTSPDESYAVVAELHRTLLKSHRVTNWKLPGAALCATTFVGKVAGSQTKVNYELSIAIRNSEGVHRSLLDANKLAGASNTSSMKPKSSVSAWFPEAENTADTRSAPITSVSSSVDGKTSSSTSDANVGQIIRHQTQRYCEQVKALEGDFLTVQKGATATMRMLQESRYRDEAQQLGKQFAARNKGRIASSGGATVVGGEPMEQGVMTEGQRELLQCITASVKEIESGSFQAASVALKVLLQKHLKLSVDKAAKESEKLDYIATADANIGSTDQARLFRNSMDATLNKQILSVVRDLHDMMKTAVDTSSTSTATVLRAAKTYTDTLRTNTVHLKDEVSDLEKAIKLAKTGAPVPTVDPNTLVQRAVSRAEAGEWKDAFVVALESGDLTVLLTFLESKVCQDNMSTITSPQTLSVTLFLSVCIQLSFELNSQPGSIPLRLHFLHLFYIDWDDYLQTMKTEAAKGDRAATTFESLKRQLISVYNSLEEVDASLLDRKTKNNHRLVSKLLSTLLRDH